MPASPSKPGPADTGYIRGGGGTDIPVGRIVQVLVVISIAALVALTVITAVAAAESNSRDQKLRHDGVPVSVTVTSCVGIGSGVGETTTYFTCRGTYNLTGHSYNEVIGGNRKSLPLGERIAAFAVPGDPKVLSTTKGSGGSSSGRYILPVILGVAAVVVALGLVLWSRRRRPA